VACGGPDGHVAVPDPAGGPVAHAGVSVPVPAGGPDEHVEVPDPAGGPDPRLKALSISSSGTRGVTGPIPTWQNGSEAVGTVKRS